MEIVYKHISVHKECDCKCLKLTQRSCCDFFLKSKITGFFLQIDFAK